MAESRVTSAGTYVEIDSQAGLLTSAGTYVEVDAQLWLLTSAGVYVSIGQEQARATSVGLYVEIEYVPPPLDASLVAFLRVQAGKQAEFDDATTPTVALPVTFEYEEGDVEQLAKWDPGVWTPLVIVERTARFATFRLRGTLFFEMLPLLLNAGFGEMAGNEVEGSGGLYGYGDSVAPGQTGEPAAYTLRLGGNDANRWQGSMVQIQDAYLHKLTLSFNLNDKAVLFESEWFGRYIDDNDGAGYAPLAVTLPPNLAIVNGLRTELGVQDAGGAEGSEFGDLTLFECSLMEWQLQIDTGVRPAWAADGNNYFYCGVRHEWPQASLTAHLRTNLDNYAITKVKANLRTYQEMRLQIAGNDNRRVRFDMTGRWLPNFPAHDRSREEVVMKPEFRVESPHWQTVFSHWLSYDFLTRWGDA